MFPQFSDLNGRLAHCRTCGGLRTAEEGAPAPLVAETRAGMTVRMALAAALHHPAHKGAGPETYAASRSQMTVNSREVAACQPGRAAGATGTGSAAHRGNHAGDVRARPVSRRSCAADGGPVGGCAQDRRQLRARAGHRISCPVQPFRAVSPPRRWRSSWWKCRGCSRRAFFVFLSRRWRTSRRKCRGARCSLVVMARSGAGSPGGCTTGW